MGSQASRDGKNYCIRLDLENSTFYAGEELSGLINLFINQPCRPDPLYLKFIGREISSFSNRFIKLQSNLLSKSSSSNSFTNTSQESNKKENLTIRKLVYQASVFESVLDPGVYCIPFKFSLPPELPGTLFYKKGEINSVISYSLKAFIVENEKKVYTKTPVIITQDPIDSSTKKVEEPVINFLGLCRNISGECRLSIVLTEEVYSNSIDSFFLLEVDNSKSSISIKNLEVSLYYFVSFNEANEVTLVENEKLFTFYEKVEIKPGEIRTGGNSVKVNLRLSKYQRYFKKRPSIKSIHTESLHYLVVRAQGSLNFICSYRYPQCMAYIRISPVMSIKKITSIKPMYGDGYFYRTVELKEYNGDYIETDQ